MRGPTPAGKVTLVERLLKHGPLYDVRKDGSLPEAAGPAWREHGYIFPTRLGTPEWGDNVLKRSLKPIAVQISDPTLDFRKLRRSHFTFYAVLNVHPAWRR
jgi:hypothetical protein